MNKNFIRLESKGIKYNVLSLPDTNLFKLEVVNMYGSNIERVIEFLENKNVYGISHFIEHLAFRAPKDYTTSELLKLIKTEGSYNASTNHDRINYWFKTTMDRSDLAINLVCNYAFNDLTAISDDEFQIEKKVVYNEAKRYADDDQTMFYFNADPLSCGNHEQDNILGIPEVIDTFTIEDAIHIKNIMMNCGETIINITYDPKRKDITDVILEIEEQMDRFDHDVNIFPEVKSMYKSMLTYPTVGDHKMVNEASQAMTNLSFDVVTNSRAANIGNAYLSSYAEDTSLSDIIREKHGLTYGVSFSTGRVSYREVSEFSCDVSRGDEELLMKLFNESINASVDAFDEAAYDQLMKTIQLKRTMTYLDQQKYDSIHQMAMWNPKILDAVAGEMTVDLVSALDMLDGHFATFEQVKEYLLGVQQYVNDGLYSRVIN